METLAGMVKLRVVSSASKQERSSVVHVEHVIDVPVPQTVEACCQWPQIQQTVAIVDLLLYPEALF